MACLPLEKEEEVDPKVGDEGDHVGGREGAKG